MTKASKPVRTLPADVYDALEFSALVFGGIGAHDFLETEDWPFPITGEAAPFCILGHAGFVTGATEDYHHNPIAVALGVAFGGSCWIAAGANNAAVESINARRKRTPGAARVSWPEYTRELNIVRGE